MLENPAPFRTANIQRDPRFWGWPSAHPDMRSFLGVPIVSKSKIIAAFYLTEKLGASDFTDEDQQLIEMLAAHAAIAIENARLYERSRELSVIEERNRLARDLHDSVTQTLFSLALTAEAADTLVGRDDAGAKEQLRQLKQMAQDAVGEMRSLIFELRPVDLEIDGLTGTLRKHIEVLRHVRRSDIDLRVTGERRLPVATERDIFRIAQEALNNALKHAGARTIAVELDLGSPVTLAVRDDGIGFDPDDPQVRARRLGLTSMHERAANIGALLDIRSSPGSGTTVRLEVNA
jgi:signal transduction histidine kinase